MEVTFNFTNALQTRSVVVPGGGGQVHLKCNYGMDINITQCVALWKIATVHNYKAILPFCLVACSWNVIRGLHVVCE